MAYMGRERERKREREKERKRERERERERYINCFAPPNKKHITFPYSVLYKV